MDSVNIRRHLRLLAVALPVLSLTACDRTPAPAAQPRAAPATQAAVTATAEPSAPGSAPPQPPAAPKAQQDAMLQAVVGDDFKVADGEALRTFEQDGRTLRERRSLVSANRLPDGRTVVMVNALPASEDDPAYPSHGTHGDLNLYFLRQNDKGWEIVGRHEEVTTLSGYGGGGEVTWLPLGGGRQGFILTTGDMGQGYSIEVSDIYELGDQVRHLGQFKKASSNDGACSPATDECWDVDSAVRLADRASAGAYPDILVAFKGKRYKVAEDTSGQQTEHLKSSIRQTARYRYDGKAYVLVSGTNPVPDV